MSDRELLRHILDEIVFLRSTAAGTTLEAFVGDEVLKRAFARSLEIVGGATKKLASSIRTEHPEIVINELPPLEAGIRSLLERY